MLTCLIVFGVSMVKPEIKGNVDMMSLTGDAMTRALKTLKKFNYHGSKKEQFLDEPDLDFFTLIWYQTMIYKSVEKTC